MSAGRKSVFSIKVLLQQEADVRADLNAGLSDVRRNYGPDVPSDWSLINET